MFAQQHAQALMENVFYHHLSHQVFGQLPPAPGGKRQVLVAVEMNQEANDYWELAPMVEKALEDLRRTPQKWLADIGNYSNANLEIARDLEAEHETEFFISTGRMKHSAPIPEAPRGRMPSTATVGERMARKLKTKIEKKVCSRHKVTVAPAFGQIHTRQGKHLFVAWAGKGGTRGEAAGRLPQPDEAP